MKDYAGDTLSWTNADGVIELTLHREPANEIGTTTLAELERFTDALATATPDAGAVIIHSTMAAGFSAGADLRELYRRSQEVSTKDRLAGVSDFLERIHRVLDTLDMTPLTTIAATHGITFGGGFELALACDLIVADKMTRFCFPELRLGLIPGFGGIPRLKRDLGNAVVRDLLLTGRSINAAKAAQVGLVSQVAGEGQALTLARASARQITKFDAETRATAKAFIKPLPKDELRQEIETFCALITRPAVEAGLRRFVESEDPYPYLP